MFFTSRQILGGTLVCYPVTYDVQYHVRTATRACTNTNIIYVSIDYTFILRGYN